MIKVKDATHRLVAEGPLTISVSGQINSTELNSDRIGMLLSTRSLLAPELFFQAVPRAVKTLIERFDGYQLFR